MPAYGTLEDCNRDLLQEYTGYADAQLFQIEYQANKPHNVKRRKDGETALTG